MAIGRVFRVDNGDSPVMYNHTGIEEVYIPQLHDLLYIDTYAYLQCETERQAIPIVMIATIVYAPDGLGFKSYYHDNRNTCISAYRHGFKVYSEAIARANFPMLKALAFVVS